MSVAVDTTRGAITRETAEGQAFAGPLKSVTLERLWTFSGGPFALDGWPKKNLHTDPAVAEAVGLPSVSASGTQYQGYLVQLLIDLFGEAWLSHGTMTAKFIAIVDAGDTLRPHAVVRSKHAEGSALSVTLEIWCENQHGARVLVGQATGLVA
jgi:hypothetical protein